MAALNHQPGVTAASGSPTLRGGTTSRRTIPTTCSRHASEHALAERLTCIHAQAVPRRARPKHSRVQRPRLCVRQVQAQQVPPALDALRVGWRAAAQRSASRRRKQHAAMASAAAAAAAVAAAHRRQRGAAAAGSNGHIGSTLQCCPAAADPHRPVLEGGPHVQLGPVVQQLRRAPRREVRASEAKHAASLPRRRCPTHPSTRKQAAPRPPVTGHPVQGPSPAA